MAHLIIKDFGPINWVEIEINKINVIIGPQSSGKSAIAKIVSFCFWLEKYLLIEQDIESVDRTFVEKQMLDFHKIAPYLNGNSRINYKCDFFEFEFSNETVSVDWKGDYENGKVSKVSYIPADRNIVSLPSIASLSLPYSNTRSFLFDWLSIKDKYRTTSRLSIPSLKAEYYFDDSKGDRVVIKNYNGTEKDLPLDVTSSGIQSAIPLYVLFDYLTKWIYSNEEDLSFEKSKKHQKIITEIYFRKRFGNLSQEEIENLTKTEQGKHISNLLLSLSPQSNVVTSSSDYQERQKPLVGTMKFIENITKPSCSKIIIEEPEQNLFPDTQKKLIYELVKGINNPERDHKLLLTTHSPYILFALNNCVMGGLVGDKIPESRYNEFESYSSWIDPKLVSVWQIEDGIIVSLQDEDGILEDNYFNQSSNKNCNEYLRLLNYYDEEKTE